MSSIKMLPYIIYRGAVRACMPPSDILQIDVGSIHEKARCEWWGISTCIYATMVRTQIYVRIYYTAYVHVNDKVDAGGAHFYWVSLIYDARIWRDTVQGNCLLICMIFGTSANANID